MQPIGAERMTEETNPDFAWLWAATIDHLLDQFSTACDSYINMMAKHNMHMLSTLAQLERDMKELLTKLNLMQNKQKLLPTRLPPSKSHGTLPMQLFQVPDCTPNQATFSLPHPQKPCTIPCPPHQQAPYKIHAFAPPEHPHTQLAYPCHDPPHQRQLSSPLGTMYTLNQCGSSLFAID